MGKRVTIERKRKKKKSRRAYRMGHTNTHPGVKVIPQGDINLHLASVVFVKKSGTERGAWPYLIFTDLQN